MAETHLVEQGECLASIAKVFGFRDYRTIYDHPRNADFKKKRPNPNIIYPGDRLYIPDKQEKTEQRPTGSRHVFQIEKRTVKLRLLLKDAKGKPYSGQPYELTVEGETFQGSTDGSGKIEQLIQPDACAGELKLSSGRLRRLVFYPGI